MGQSVGAVIKGVVIVRDLGYIKPPMATHYPKIGRLESAGALRDHWAQLGWRIPVDDRPAVGTASPLHQPFLLAGRPVGNRWCIHPMEGWDGHPDGSPSDRTLRRWQRFGESGAKLIWGGEAAAVRADGRANPRQLMAIADHIDHFVGLRRTLVDAHRACHGTTDDLCIGLQLTHSGRFCRPHDHRLEPRIAYHHPLLDPKFGIGTMPGISAHVWTDAELDGLIEDYVRAARLAREAGFDFVDVKACHGYLLHEFLSAQVRPGPYGGDLAGRTRLLRTIIRSIRQVVPDLLIGVRLSVFDTPPFVAGPEHGVPMDYAKCLPYSFGFGVDRADPLRIDLTEPIDLLRTLRDEGVVAVNVSCGSPYYNPHLQRPAIFPPSDGYFPPEDPLVGVARQITAARDCKQAVPDLPMIGTGYTYLQEYLPHVAQAVVRAGWIDSVGLGRMVLSYPTLPADLIHGRPWQRKLVCRTFSDCTTAPRNGLVSGCYPLDPYYRALPEAELLRRAKDT